MDLLPIILRDALIVFPLVLGVGLLWSHSRTLDVSVDGIAVLAGIACATVWRATSSYTLSLGAAVLCGITCSLIVCLLVQRLRINSIMAGLAFSIVAYAGSILLVGESIALPGTALLPGFQIIPAWLPALAAVLCVLSYLFAYSRVGLEIRALGTNPEVRTSHSGHLLQIVAYGYSGALYGCGAGMYVHGQGLARSGGGFEFLVFSLCAYLSFDQLFALMERMMWRARAKTRRDRVASLLARHAVAFATAPASRALLGAILFQAVVFLSILWAPHPSYWKLIMACILLLALIDMGIFQRRRSPRIKEGSGQNCEHQSDILYIHGLTKHYDIGVEQRAVFAKAGCSCGVGVNTVRGPNGAGKSTLLHIIAGTVRCDSGVISLGRLAISSLAASDRPVFLLHQQPFRTLAIDLPIVESLALVARPVNSMPRHFPSAEHTLNALFDRLLAMGIDPLFPRNADSWYRPAATLSGGEATIIGLHMASLTDAKILLIDEPSTGLDAANLSRVMMLIRALARERIVILTTHDDRLDVLARTRYVITNHVIEEDTRSNAGRDTNEHLAAATAPSNPG